MASMIQTKSDLVIMIVLCMVEFFAFFSFSMIAPFYPVEAKEKYHVSSFIQGLVFAIHPLAVFLLSPYVGKVISTPGRTKPCIIVGTIMMVAGNMLFAVVNQFRSVYIFLALSFGARIVIAVGTSLANTASLAFLTEKFKAHLSAVFGITELFVGVGFMAGPSVGSVLYGDDRFWLPFTVVGGLNFLNLIFLWFFVPGEVDGDASKQSLLEKADNEAKQVTISDSLKIPAVWIVCLTIHTIGLVITFLQPVLSFHLQTITHHHISIERIGLVFFLCPAVYAVFAPILGIYVDQWFNPRNLIIAGHFMTFACYFFMGPSPLLHSFLTPIKCPRNLIIAGHFMTFACYFFMGPSPLLHSFLTPSVTVTSVAFALEGFAQCPLMVPVIADLQMAIVNAGYPSGPQTSSIVSGLFTSAINLGQVTGPSLAGFLQGYMEFPWSSTIVAFFVLAEGFLILFFTMWEKRTWNICCSQPKDGYTEIVKSHSGSSEELTSKEKKYKLVIETSAETGSTSRMYL